MRFDHIGGLDMAWRALAGGQILVEPPPVISPQTVAATIARHRVEVLAATPSFLNLLLLSDAPRTHDLGTLRVVPYGAEAMPAGLLDRLRSALPAVEFVQRFGTSETGTLPVVAGEGGMRLRPGAAGYEWKVLGGELWVLSPGRALGYLSGGSDRWDESGWFQTGDLAESLSDGSIRVLGRMQDLINVGGEKVLPDEVESFLLGHPQVADCRVGAAANAVLGQVVAADVVWLGPERDPVAVRRLVQHYAEGRIARHKVPVAVRLVDSIASTRNGKKLRLASA
jgi:acyl-coenzyme A synthetase/AMP-(fatty) acid ligase